ncbi:1,4-dihydroxy-2-naphthoyl-CoA hydrolase [Erwinia toletana]|uniref:1,4-dihydroxy-2-naphthoyl-CoA hydrolase n=1 Tax=Winslowiella toletana TaxID=92490 RepID=A0ABS4PGD5_9GAMM|nr:hotdog fold thioesterase [Winslowiella toletana]MBP2171217.1 1,4-dihydroxy-2-naphthoyl-CoA hydrolase [Winslowiella toletana]
MAIWKRETTLLQLNQRSAGCMVEHLGIRFTALTDDSLAAMMPVDHRTTQPFGLLHGGASAALAETLGSMAGYLCTTGDDYIVGLEINANHIRSAREGEVRGVCRPLHLGRSHQVWQIEIFDQQDQLCCISRLTTSVMQRQ